MALLSVVANPFGKSHRPVPDAELTEPNLSEIPKSNNERLTGNVDSAIVVRKEGEDDIGFDSSRLLQAMQTAMGKEGWVELRNHNPLHIASDQAGDLASGQGRLIIRAATGIQPVIELEIKGGRPFLSAGSAVPLELSGLLAGRIAASRRRNWASCWVAMAGRVGNSLAIYCPVCGVALKAEATAVTAGLAA